MDDGWMEDGGWIDGRKMDMDGWMEDGYGWLKDGWMDGRWMDMDGRWI